jgi:hypothetical protein
LVSSTLIAPGQLVTLPAVASGKTVAVFVSAGREMTGDEARMTKISDT